MSASYFSARICSGLRRVSSAAARGVLPAAVALAAVLSAGTADAQTLVTWTGTGGNTSWSTTSNWTAGGPPTTSGTWGLTLTGTNQAVSGTLTMSDDIGGTTSALTLSGLSIVSTASTTYIISRGGSRTFTLIDGGTISTVNASNSRSRIGVPITLSGSATFDLANANDLQLDGGLSGGTTFTKSGNGVLYMQNNFSQNVNLTGGQIYMSGNAVASGTITMNGGNFVAGNGNSSAQFAFLQNGQVRAWGGATAVFTSSTFNLPSAAASDVALTLNSAQTGTSAIQGVIQDNTSKKVALSLNNSGANWRLSGSNTYSGGTTLSSGVNLIADNASALGRGLVTANGNLNVNGLTLTVNGLAGTTGVIGSATNASVIAVDTTGTSTTFSGTIQNGSGTMGLTVLGTGTLAISGSNTHSGATNVNAGTLRIANQNAVQNSTVTMSGGSLVFDSSVTGNAFTFGGLSGTTSGAGYDIALRNNAGTPAAVALTVGGNNASTTYAGALSGSGSLTKTGSGTLTLSGSNTYSGVTTASGGVLQVATPASLYSGSTASWTAANIKTGSGAMIAVNVGASNFTTGNVTTLLTNLGGLGGSVNNNGLQAGSAIGFDTSNAGGSFTIADAIKDSTGTGGGAIGLVKLGSGTLALTGSNTYTGVTNVNGGVLALGTSAALAGGGNVTFGGGTLQFSASNTADYSARIRSSASAISIDTNAQSVPFASTIDATNVGGFTKLGSGTLTFSGSNSYTGGTQINAGVVTMGNAYALSGSGANVTIASGAMLDLAGVSGTTAARYNLTLSGSGIGNLGAITNTVATGATVYLASGTLAGDTTIKSQNQVLNIDSTSGISGTAYALTFDTPWPMVVTGTVNVGSLVKIGSLALELSTAGSPGSTQINNGSLILRNQMGSGTVSLGDTTGSNSTTLNLATGAMLSNPIVVRAGNNGTASIDNYTNWAPVLSGTLTLNKDVLLRNTSTNNTGWTVSGGIVGSGGITILNSGTVTAPITLSGSNTFTGTTTMSSANPGTLQVGNVWALQNSTLDTGSAGNQSVAFTAAGANTYVLGGLRGSDDLAIGANSIDVGRNNASTTYAAAISGAGGLTKSGAGTFTLSGSNTYAGATTISAGQLQISAGNINFTSGITLNGAGAELKYNSATALTKPLTLTQGTLSGSGAIGTAVTVGSSAILSPGNSPGSQSFTNGLTFAQGGQYTWEINNWAGSAGTNYDQLVVSGSALNITATSGSTFKILVTSLTGSNTAGAVPGFVGTTGTTFTIATSSPAMTGFDKSKFTIDTSTFTNNNTLPTNAGFWLSTNGGSTSLLLNYAPSATYNLSAAATATAIRVGGTSTITATVTSSTASLTNPDTMSYTGLTLSGSAGALLSTSGTLASGSASSGNAAFTTVATGSYTFNPSLSSATNVNIATSANAGTNSGVTVSVYNPASANSPLSAVSLGNVYASGTFGTQALSIWNTGTAAAAYQEGLAAAVNGTSGQATGSGSFTNLFTSSTSTAISVGLGGNASTGSAGVKSGTVTLGFTSTGTTSVGATGLSPLTLSSQDVAVTGTVWNPAAVNTITSPVSLGNVRVSGTFGTQALSIQNTAASGSYTEVLGATGSTSGLASLTGSVAGLAGGGTSTAISVGLGGAANTTTAGVKSGSATVSFTSTGGPGTAVINSQTVAISGTVWNPAAANSISGTINLGTVLKGTSLSQALSISNTAPADGYSEKLDAAFGTLTGVATTNSSSISLLAAGGTSTAMSVGLDTSAAGSRSGAVDVAFTSNGLDTSGLGTLSLAPQTVNLTATVLDPATALLVGGSTSGSNWLINLGEFNQGSGTSSPFSFGISNLSQTAGFTADLFMASFLNPTSSGAIFTDLSGTSSFATLGAGGTNSFSAWMSLATTGTFTNVYNLSFNSSKNGTNLGGTPQNMTLTVTGVIVVPEPEAIALAGIGIAAAAWALRRRK